MRKIVKILDGSESIFDHCLADADGGILFDDGLLMIGEHSQDCCEHVYADWSVLTDEAGLMDTDFSDLTLEMRNHRKNRNGIRICGTGRKFFVPCYNDQNGYYSDQLDIVLLDTKQLENVEVGCSWHGNKLKPYYSPTYKEIKRWECVPVIDNIY